MAPRVTHPGTPALNLSWKYACRNLFLPDWLQTTEIATASYYYWEKEVVTAVCNRIRISG